MPSHTVPRSGLPIDFAQKPLAANNIIGLTLTDDAIEKMIAAVQGGEDMQLSFGPEPSLSYVSHKHELTKSTSQDPFAYEIYSFASTSISPSSQVSKGPGLNKNNKLVHIGPASMFFETKKPAMMKGKMAAGSARQAASSATSKNKIPAGTDAALEALKANNAKEKAAREANTTIRANSSALPPAKQTKGLAKYAKNGIFGSAGARKAMGRNLGSIPTSPALNTSSPKLAPTSAPASEIQAEKIKAIRSPVIHMLAAAALSKDELMIMKPAGVVDADFRQAIDKVADNENGLYVLKKMFYRDLDVWNFQYPAESERQRAIDNAVKQYDKMRLSASDPLWQLLLPVEERNKGKCLGKLQARIATGPMQPKPKVDSTPASGAEDDDLHDEKSAPGSRAANVARSKAHKEREAQEKRLSRKASGKSKAAVAKAAPKAAPKAAQKKGAPAKNVVKSTEFVNDSDEEDDYLPPTTTSARPAVSTNKSTEAPKQTPAQMMKASQGTKRKSDGEDTDASVKKAKTALSSSASSTSGSQKSIPPPRFHSSQTQRSVASVQNSISNARNKAMTSPKKSSPLASSPPVSANDMEESDKSSVSPPAESFRKCKVETSAASRELEEFPRKKGKAASTEELEGRYKGEEFTHKGFEDETKRDAERFAVLYERYTALWHELAGREERDEREMGKLARWEEELRGLKARVIEGARDA